MMETATQRLDKWLWFARLIKTRSQATALVNAGKVRVNSVKVKKPSTALREGDVLTAVIHQKLRIVKVLAPGQRRGPAPEAQELYEDLTPEEDKSAVKRSSPDNKKNEKPVPVEPAPAPTREKGAGRPTKRDRRKMTEFHTTSVESSEI